MENSSFNIEEFDIKLDTELIAKRFVYVVETDSTNAMLLKSDEFTEHGTVLLAEKQEKGRGRLGREWLSQPEQNLTFSILLRKVNPKTVNIINLGASLAVAQSLANLFQLNPRLKWPNDVLINEKKIAGILLESSSKSNIMDKVVIGIGINVNQTSFPGKFLIAPTSVKKEFQSHVSRERLLSETLNIFEEILLRVESDPQSVINDWKEKCKMIGEKVNVTTEKESKFGVFEDIDEQGYMVLNTAGKKERIHFGDVTLR